MLRGHRQLPRLLPTVGALLLGAFLGAVLATPALGQPHNLVVFKGSTLGSPYSPGEQVSYTITVLNEGADADTVTVQDDLPGVLTDCTWTADFDPGVTGNTSGSGDLDETVFLPSVASANFNVTCTVGPLAPNGELDNTATVQGVLGESDLTDNSATATITIIGSGRTDVGVTKTTDTAEVAPGGSLTFTVVVTNLGPNDASFVEVLDPLIPDLTCSWTSVASGGASGNGSGSGDLLEFVELPVGASMTYTLDCTVSEDSTSAVVANRVTLSYDGDPNSFNDVSDASAIVVTPDLGVEKTAAATALPGESVVYTVAVANTGGAADPAARVTDSPPGAASCTWTASADGGATGALSGSGALDETVALPADSGITYLITCPVDAAATGTLVNSASVTASGADASSGNDTDQVTVTLAPTADLSLTKTDGVARVVRGGTVTYDLVATNAGPSDDPAVRIQDPLDPELTCTWTGEATGGASGQTDGSGALDQTVSMPAGSTVRYVLTCSIDPTADGTLVNTATVTASVTDPMAANDTASDETIISPEADVAVTKDAGLDQVKAGGSLSYTVVVRNDGPDDDPAVTIADTLPSTLDCTWTSVSDGGATGSAGTGSGDLAETLSLPAGSSVTYALTCRIALTATAPLTNSATALGSVLDPIPTNDTATTTTALIPHPIPVDQPWALLLLAMALVGLGWRRLMG